MTTPGEAEKETAPAVAEEVKAADVVEETAPAPAPAAEEPPKPEAEPEKVITKKPAPNIIKIFKQSIVKVKKAFNKKSGSKPPPAPEPVAAAPEPEAAAPEPEPAAPETK